MIKLFALRKNEWALLLSILCIGFSCGNHQSNKTLFYEDFNFQCYCGVNEISPEDTGKLNGKEHRFYKLFYKDDQLDSMVVFHPWNKQPPVKLKCLQKDSLKVLQGVYSALGREGKETYFYFNNHTFMVYQYLGEDGWLVHNVTSNQSSRGVAFLFKPGSQSYKGGPYDLDTIGFANKLLQHEKFQIENKSALRDTTLTARITKNFTFNTWFNSDGL